MMIKPIYIFSAVILISVLLGFIESDSDSSIMIRTLTNILFGIGVGIMAFNDKTEPLIAKLCGIGVGFFFMLGFITLYLTSAKATLGTLVTGFIVSVLLYWAVSRTQ